MRLNTLAEQGSRLQGLLSTLKINRERVPLDVLKTTYQIPYYQLITQINMEATQFVKTIALHHLLINPRVSFDEQVRAIQHTVDTSETFQEICRSICTFYDVDKLQQLAWKLREEIKDTLWYYINMETCLVVDLENIGKDPIIYNTLTKQVYENNQWVDCEVDLSWKLLIYILNKPYDKQASTISSQEALMENELTFADKQYIETGKHGTQIYK